MIKLTSTLLGLIMILSAVGIHGRVLQDYTPSTWIYKCLNVCPQTPLDLCDFYFQGYMFNLPVFDDDNVTTAGNDTMLTPPVMEKILNRTIDIHLTSRPACYLNQKNVTQFTNLYYARGVNHIGHVMLNETVNKCNEFCGKCVLLYAVQARPHWADKSFTQLLSGDGNSVYPEDRRCVVFKTTPCY